MNYNIKKVNIDTIKAGDTVEHNSEIRTVCSEDIKRSSFMGASLFGDNYHSGHKPVKLINITRATI